MTRSMACIIVTVSVFGAFLTAGVMWWRAATSGVPYSTESWALIPVLWLAPALAAAVSVHLRSVGSLAVIVTALIASTYFMDVLGFVPGAIITACGIEAFLRERFGARTTSVLEM
jgi:hypothetical protein